MEVKYFFIKELPPGYAEKKLAGMYFKGMFTWLVAKVTADMYFHYTRMPSGRLLCKYYDIPFNQ